MGTAEWQRKRIIQPIGFLPLEFETENLIAQCRIGGTSRFFGFLLFLDLYEGGRAPGAVG
jgi:hypothetical protein